MHYVLQVNETLDRHGMLAKMIIAWSFLLEPTGRGCCWILLLVLAAADAVSFDAVSSIDGGSGAAPCIHDGHLKTERNWFGYLANISVAGTGRLTFEFSYPAEKCCQNILFYSEDQISIISARMNCWQKEYLLRPEDDQILRLTPRFSWSGCHMTHPNGKPTYVCEGGRSFTVEQQQQLQHHQPPSTSGLPGSARAPLTTWYIAVSNCATLQGLDLQYRLVIHGHMGECRSRSMASGRYGSMASHAGTGSSSALANPRSILMPRDSASSSSSSELVFSDAVCVLDGDLNSTVYWYGFLVNASLVRGGGFRYRFSYPYHMQVQNVLLYSEDDAAKLQPDQTCWEKEGVIRSRKAQEQILDLSFRSSWNGCISKNVTTDAAGGRTLLCQGERRYDEPRTVLFAVSNCRSTNGLILNYHLEIYGYSNAICSTAVAQFHHSHFCLWVLVVSIAHAQVRFQ